MYKVEKDKSTVKTKKSSSSKNIDNQIMDQSSIQNVDDNKEELLLQDEQQSLLNTNPDKETSEKGSEKSEQQPTHSTHEDEEAFKFSPDQLQTGITRWVVPAKKTL